MKLLWALGGRSMRIGVDVGGTNTDAVMMDGTDVVATVKTATTRDVGSGIVQAIERTLAQAGSGPTDVRAVMIGTTQLTNALVERSRLARVAIIRICLPSNADLRPMLDWPAGLVGAVDGATYLVAGGYEFDGAEIAPLGEAEVVSAARDIRRRGIRNVAVSCIFSPANDSMEKRAAQILLSEHPEANITLSSELGRLGMIERENAAIMNAALAQVSNQVVTAFKDALVAMRIQAPCFLSQNDGTLMSAEYAQRYPVLTFASGPTNSMRGAAFLCGSDIREAIVVDIGGTTTDVGALTNGYPRESSAPVNIGGVRTNFRMPDVLSIGLGGGSTVAFDDGCQVGPNSVGLELAHKAMVFGGGVLTATDIAVAAGSARIGDAALVADLPANLVSQAHDRINHMVDSAIDRMKMSADPLPVVLVGGGSDLISRTLQGASDIHVPKHAEVANAIGAAMAQVSGEVDGVFRYDALGRKEAIERAETKARRRAIAAGADPDSIRLVDRDEIPLAYLAGGPVRVRVKVVGDLLMGDDQCITTKTEG